MTGLESSSALITTCPYRKSDPDVLMIRPTEMRLGHGPTNGLSRTRDRCILVQRPFRSPIPECPGQVPCRRNQSGTALPRIAP